MDRPGHRQCRQQGRFVAPYRPGTARRLGQPIRPPPVLRRCAHGDVVPDGRPEPPQASTGSQSCAPQSHRNLLAVARGGVEPPTFRFQFKVHPEGVGLPGTSRFLLLRVGYRRPPREPQLLDSSIGHPGTARRAAGGSLVLLLSDDDLTQERHRREMDARRMVISLVRTSSNRDRIRGRQH